MTDDDSPAFTISHDGSPMQQPADNQPVLDLHPRPDLPVAAVGQPAPPVPPQPTPQPQAQTQPQVVSNYYYGAQNAPRGATEVGRETITIAPHPTTNRFPWAPVDNPSIPVYRADQPLAAPVQAPEALQPAPPVAALPPVPMTEPEPEPEPEPESEPIIVPVQAAPTPVTRHDILPPPIEPPISVPLPPPQPAQVPIQARAPEVAVEPVAEPTRPPAPAVADDTTVHEPPHSAPVAAAPAKPAPPSITAPVVKSYDGPHGIRIYGESNRQVWKVLKPGTTITAVVVVIIAMTLLMVLLLWLQAGRPHSLLDIPVIKTFLQTAK